MHVVVHAMCFVDQSQDPVIHVHGQLAESSGVVNGNHGASFESDGRSSDSDSDDPGLNYHGSFRLSSMDRRIQVHSSYRQCTYLLKGMWA